MARKKKAAEVKEPEAPQWVAPEPKFKVGDRALSVEENGRVRKGTELEISKIELPTVEGEWLLYWDKEFGEIWWEEELELIGGADGQAEAGADEGDGGVKVGLMEVSVENIIPSPNNPRRIKDGDPRVAELADSIRALGVLEPVLLRPAGCLFQLMAGERRWRAAKLAGFRTIPAIVRNLDDQAALEVTVTENLQRADLSPIEEARGLRSLLDSGYDLRDAADRLGKNRFWVAQRERLTCLIEEFAEAATGQGELIDLSGWSVRALELVARLPEETQRVIWEKEVAKEQEWARSRFARLTAGGVEEMIGRYTRELAKVPWDLKRRYDMIRPCATCPARSAAQPDLFASEKGEAGEDRCLDPECYVGKMKAYREEFAREAEREHHGLLRVSAAYQCQDKALIPYSDYNHAQKGDKGAVPAMVMDSSGTPEVIWVKLVERDGDGEGTGSGKGKGKKQRTVAELKAEVDRERRRETARLVAKAVRELAERGDVPNTLSRVDMLACVLAVGLSCSFISPYEGSPWGKIEEYQNISLTGLYSELGLMVAHAFDDRLDNYSEKVFDEAQRVARLFEIDFDELVIQAQELKPYGEEWREEALQLGVAEAPEEALYTEKDLKEYENRRAQYLQWSGQEDSKDEEEEEGDELEDDDPDGGDEDDEDETEEEE